MQWTSQNLPKVNSFNPKHAVNSACIFSRYDDSVGNDVTIYQITIWHVVAVSELFGNLHSRGIMILFFRSIISTVPCSAGSFSPNGLAPCFLCDRRSFQPRKESQVCFSCPGTTITMKAGSKNSQDCIG